MTYILYIILTLLTYKYFALRRKYRREEAEYLHAVGEMYAETQQKRATRHVISWAETVNQHAHQQNYERDILNYRDVNGKPNQQLAKEVYFGTYRQVRKSNGERVTPDLPHDDEYLREFVNLSAAEFELKVCKDMAANGLHKEAVQRWQRAVKEIGTVTVNTKADKKEQIFEWENMQPTSENFNFKSLPSVGA